MAWLTWVRAVAGLRCEVDPASARRIVEEFLAAASSGRTERLVALLTDDAIAVSDGAGGLAEKLLRYDTPQRIAAVVRTGLKPTPAKRRLAGGTPAIHYAVVNGGPAILFVRGDRVIGSAMFDIAEGKIATVLGIASPTCLARLTESWRQHEPDTPLITQW